MRKIVVTLLVVMNLILFAQPAFAESNYSNELVFKENLDPNAQTTYFDPQNATPLPQELGLTEGIYKGPQYPFAAVQLDIRDLTIIYLNFTVNLSYQDIMNGAWDWELLLPLTGDFQSWSLYLNDSFIAGDHTEYDHDIPKPNTVVNTTETRYGMLLEFYYPIYPHSYNFSFKIIVQSPPILYLCRETQSSTLTVIQHNKTTYNVHAAYALLFKRGFGQKGMGAITAREISFYFIDGTVSNRTFTTLGLPVWIFQGTKLTMKLHEYINGSEITYINESFDKTGFYYIFQSSSRPADWNRTDYYTVRFDLNFSQPVKFLFCTLAPSPHQFGIDGEYAGNTVKLDGKPFDYFGIVYWHHVGSDQYALISKQGNMTIYDFGFASVQEYSTGDYVIFPHGNWHKYVVIKNMTVKSIGAKVDDILFGGAFSFSANNDILSVLMGGLTKIYDLLKQTWQFLQNLGQMLWQYLMKFVKFLVDLASWIWDNLAGIFNYLLYVFMPIAIMFIISYTARWAKGLRATDEQGVKQ